MELNKEQKYIVDEAYKWFYNSSEQVFQYSGGPGTGKTFTLLSIIDRLGLSQDEILPMAYIGAAAIVMRTRGLQRAGTIHSSLYTPINGFKKDNDGNMVINNYYNKPISDIEFVSKNLSGIKLIIIDEAYSVPISLKRDIESYGIKILACGDIDQLPPVSGDPAYLVDGKIHYLTQIMRQAEGSGIIYIKERIRNNLPIHTGWYNNALVIYEDELTNQMIANSDMIICGKNETRENINNRVRYNILHRNSELPTFGERVVCRKNNRLIESDGINLANGLVGIVNNFPDVSSFDGKLFSIDFKPNLMNTCFYGIPCNYKYFTGNSMDRERIKKDKYEKGECFEFAYAITAHISQGSQYVNGIYIEEYLNPSINKKLNYVGVTRFSNSLIYVIRKPKTFYNEYKKLH